MNGSASGAARPDRRGPGGPVRGWLSLSGGDARDLIARGASVVACPAVTPGRRRRPDCPVMAGRTCPLRAHADRVLGGFGEEGRTGTGADPVSAGGGTGRG